jgi:hypothetical protein
MGYVQVSVTKSLLVDGDSRPPWSLSSLSYSLLTQAMKPPGSQGSQSTYTDLLSVIEEMGKEIRPTYAGSKSAMERLKRGKGSQAHPPLPRRQTLDNPYSLEKKRHLKSVQDT